MGNFKEMSEHQEDRATKLIVKGKLDVERIKDPTSKGKVKVKVEKEKKQKHLKK